MEKQGVVKKEKTPSSNSDKKANYIDENGEPWYVGSKEDKHTVEKSSSVKSASKKLK